MSKDISRKSVMVLVLIAVVISILSTFFVLNAVYNTPTNTEPSAQEPKGTTISAGTASLTVPLQPPSAQATATIIVNGG